MQILLVDDKKDILDTMGEILEVCHNHIVQGASSGKEALKWFKKKKYDLVVVDLALPVMNGVEVIAKMRKLRPKTMIVVLTGIPCNDTLREKLKQLGLHPASTEAGSGERDSCGSARDGEVERSRPGHE